MSKLLEKRTIIDTDDHLSSVDLHKIFAPDRGFVFVHNIPIGDRKGVAQDIRYDYEEVPWAVFDNNGKLQPDYEVKSALYKRIRNYDRR